MDWDEIEGDSVLRDVGRALEAVTDDTRPAIPINFGHHPYVAERARSYDFVCGRLGREDSPELTRMIKASDAKPYQMNLYGSTRSSLIAIFELRRRARGTSWEFMMGSILVVPGGAFRARRFGNSGRLSPRFNLYQVLGPPKTWHLPPEMVPPRPTKLGQSDRELANDFLGLPRDHDPSKPPHTSRNWHEDY